LFAVSSGAPVAYTFVARHPERVWALVTIDGVSRADPGAGKSSAVRRVFVDTVGQRLAQLTAAVSLSTVLSSKLEETSTFAAAQKKQRIDYITHDDDVPFADGADAAARISGSQHSWMPSEDHLGFWLRPDRAQAQSAVHSFLQERQSL